MATYKYQPLLNPRSTRLVELEPAKNFKAPLRFKLFQILLDRPPRYNALSYSWGGQTPQQQLLCNGDTWLKVTQNVETLLRYARLPDQPHLLWIDSICIDQSSIPERNQQISIMKEIYERAGQVLVWLGESSNYSDSAIIQLNRGIRNARGNSNNIAQSVYADEIAPHIAGGIMKAAFTVFGGSKTGHSKVGSGGVGLSHFLSRPVFVRMWCVQEMALGREVVLVCGRSTITLEQMIAGLDRMERIYSNSLGLGTTVLLYKSRIGLQKELRDIVRAIRTSSGPRHLPALAEIINSSRFRGATDPRDKVFSLVGMFQLMGVNFPLPDYSKQVRQVYQEVTVAAITINRSLDILYQVSGLPNEFNLPSWVPDISDISPPSLPLLGAFNATSNSIPTYRYSPNDSTLTITGKVLDIITACGMPLKHPAAPGSEPSPPGATSVIALTAFKQWHSLAFGLSTYPATEQPTSHAFGCTLLTEAAIMGVQNPKALYEIFPKWLAMLTSTYPEGLLTDDSSLQRTTGGDAATREFDLSLSAATLVQIMSYGGRDKSRIKNLHDWLHLNLRRKRFFVTGRGFMGTASAAVEVGDTVVLIKGLRLPFVLRQEKTRWKLVSPAYVCGAMRGEVWSENDKMDEFVLC